MTTNALLDFTDLPRFDLFQASHVAPAVTQLLEDARSTITQLEQSEAIGWDTFVVPLEAVTERLGRAWGVVGHLNAVVDTPELRAAYNENLPKVTEFWTELGQNLKLFEKYKALQASHEYTALSSARKRIVDTRCVISVSVALNSLTTKKYVLQKFRSSWLHSRHGFQRTCWMPPMLMS